MPWGRRVRRWLVGIGAVALPGGAAFGWWVWLPRAVEDKVVEVASRYGFEAEVDGASAGFSSLELDRIVLEHERGISLELEDVSVAGSPIDLAFDGSSAIRGVDVRRLGARLDVARGAHDVIREARQRDVGPSASRPSTDSSAVSPAPSTRSTTPPPIRVHDGALEVRDADARAWVSGAISLDGGELRWSRGGVQLGAEGRTWLEADGIEARARRGESGWKVVSASAHAAKWSTDQPLDAELALAKSFVRPREGESRVPIEPPPDEEPPWSRWLDPEAAFAIETLTLARASGDFGQLAVEATRAEDRVRLGGRGTVQNGEVRWSLEVIPDAPSASGTIFLREAPFDLFVAALPELPWWHPELARVSADLTIEASSPAEVRLRGSASVRDLAVESARIAPHPVRGLTAEAEGEARWHPDARRLIVDDARVLVGAARVNVRGEISRGEHFALDVRASLEPTDCDAAIHSIPDDLLQEASGFRWAGRIGGTLRLSLDTSALDATRLDLRVANGCRFEQVPVIADLRRFEGPFLHRVVEPDGSVFEMMAGPGSDNWISIHEIHPYFVHAVIAHEDGGFFGHSGFATYAIRDALVRNVREGRYVQGASTISMQLTKNLLLHREKTLARKLQEVLLTWWIETALDKAHILELYLNVIEYAPGVYGIVRGADHYFGRSPAELTLAEAAFLACVLPGPKVHHEHYVRGSLSTSMRNRVRRFVEHLHARGRVDATARDEALAQLESFSFHRPGQSVVPRPSAGRATPLPFASAIVDVPEDVEGWNDYGPDEGDGQDEDTE